MLSLSQSKVVNRQPLLALAGLLKENRLILLPLLVGLPRDLEGMLLQSRRLNPLLELKRDVGRPRPKSPEAFVQGMILSSTITCR
jgi:hypothetical protein